MKIEETLKQRGKNYGGWADNSLVSQKLKAIISEHAGPAHRPDHLEALEMIAQKMARILNGDPDYTDNWHDIAGYATLEESLCRTHWIAPNKQEQ